jgi:hypothetical protein
MVLMMLGNFRQVHSETMSHLSRPVLQDESYLSSISILRRKTRDLLIYPVWAKLREVMVWDYLMQEM